MKMYNMTPNYIELINALIKVISMGIFWKTETTNQQKTNLIKLTLYL